MTGYYDYVLGAIPLTLFGLSGGLSLAGLSLTAAVPIAATVAVLLIGHALFVNAPVDSGSRTIESASSPNAGPVNAD